MSSKFWMVYVENSSGSKVRHSDYDTALKEAKRLARLNNGKSVYLMEGILIVSQEVAPLKLTPITWD